MKIIPKYISSKVKWEDSPETYNERLYNLGKDTYDIFFVLNENIDVFMLDKVNINVDTDKCVIWYLGSTWIFRRYTSKFNSQEQLVEIHDNSLHSIIESMMAPTITYNLDIPAIIDIPDISLQAEHYNMELVWYLDPVITNTDDKIWIKKIKYIDSPSGIIDMGIITPQISTKLDVVFISYNEHNAEYNWNRLLEKCPTAKRIDKVDGILNAHKAAAEIVETDMFYVVDGDAYINNDFNFDFNPTIFKRDNVFIFKSVNPVNGLIYGHGGVKIFPTQLLRDLSSFETDLTTTAFKKLILMDVISNTTIFNITPESAWFSGFREAAKLTKHIYFFINDNESVKRLERWMSVGSNVKNGNYTILGAIAGNRYAEDNILNINNINDYNWLQDQFNNSVKSIT